MGMLVLLFDYLFVIHCHVIDEPVKVFFGDGGSCATVTCISLVEVVVELLLCGIAGVVVHDGVPHPFVIEVLRAFGTVTAAEVVSGGRCHEREGSELPVHADIAVINSKETFHEHGKSPCAVCADGAMHIHGLMVPDLVDHILH